MAADNVLGSVQIVITGDSSKLQSDFAIAQATAQRAGAQISSALTSALAPGMKAAGLLVDQFGRSIEATSVSAEKAEPAIKSLAQRAIELANAERSGAVAAEELAQAHGHAVSEIQATSGALRVLEGSGGLRAAERFIATTLGIGPALQAIFPIVGAIAFLDVLIKGGEKISELWTKFDGLAAAEKRATDQAEELGAEIGKVRQKAEDLAAVRFEEAFGRVASYAKDAADMTSRINVDLARQSFLVANIAQQQAIANKLKAQDPSVSTTQSNLLANVRAYHAAIKEAQTYEAELHLVQGQIANDQEEQAQKSRQSMQTQVDDTKKAHDDAETAAREFAQKQKQADDLELAQMKSQHALSVGDLIKYWRDKLATEGDGAQRSREIQITLGNLYQEQDKVIQKIQERGLKIQEEQAKRAEKQQSFLSEMAVEGEILANKIGADIAKINAQLAVAGAKGSSQSSENALAQQRLQLERDYALQIAKTAQSQIAYAQQIAAADKAEMDEKIHLLEVERSIETDKVKQADLDNKISQAKDQAAQKEFSAQTRIQQLIQQNTAIARVQIGIWNTFNGVFSKLSQGLASAIVGAQSFGAAMKSVVQSVGQEILQTLIGVALKGVQEALGSIVAKWLGIQIVSTAASKAQIAQNAAVVGAQLAGIATATSAQIGANALILNDTLGMYLAIAAVASATDVSEVAGEAAVGGAAAFASTAAIPIIGPALAPAAGAAAYAAILGTFGPLAAFEKGGLVPETMMALVHKGEWVTPAAQVAQGITGPNAGGASGNTYVTINSYSIAETARAMAKYMKSAGGMRFSPASSS